MSLFSSKVKTKDLRNPQAKAADAWLLDLLKRDVPEMPAEQVAGMSPAEQLAQELVMGYGRSTPEGLDVLRSIAGESGDITQDPTIAALMSTIGRRGDESANRLSRSLMLRGGRGGAGRDMLGRAVTQTQQEMLSTLAPYAESAKNRRMSAAQLLHSLGEGATLNRLNALSTTGSLPRTLEQMQNAANYNRLMQEIMFPYEQQRNVAGILSNSQDLSVIKQPSMVSQLSPLIGKIAGSSQAMGALGGLGSAALGGIGSLAGGAGAAIGGLAALI